MKASIFSNIATTLRKLVRGLFPISTAVALSLVIGLASAQTNSTASRPVPSEGHELPVHKIPNLGRGAEFYFSPDSTHIIGNAQREGDSGFRVYTLKIDGTDIRRIEDKGAPVYPRPSRLNQVEQDFRRARPGLRA